MTTWLAVIAGALSLVNTLVTWLRDTRRIDDATAAAVLNGVRESDGAITRAKAARDLVRADLQRDPSRMRDDDGFRRDGD